MDVGQVYFSIEANNLDAVLNSARELDSILNGIDGKTYGSKGGSGSGRNIVNRRLKTHQKAMRMVANDEKRYAEQQHAREVKAEKTRFNGKRKAMKLAADIEYKAAIRQREADKKAEAEKAKQEEKSQKRKNDLRREQAELEKKIAIQGRKDRIKNEKDALKQQEELARAPYEYQKKTQQNLVNFGAQMQTLGATVERFTNPFMDVYRGLAMGVGYRMLGKVTQSISGAFSRYDTLKTYAKVLGNLGVDATKKFSVGGQEAADVYTNLENAVLGLPTGIDEIIESMRRYAGATGEAERATKLAIAANNAYIAGGMGEREKLFTERQLRSLAAGKTLTPNQWDSLTRNAPLMMRSIADELKISTKELDEALKDGTISGEKFLDTLIKLGTEGSLQKAAGVMKATWDAVSQNVQNRLNAMGQGILDTLDTVFEKMDGRTFLQHVLGFDKDNNYIKGKGLRGIIDDISQSTQNWIKAHPEKIIDFLENLKQIDIKGIASGFAEMGLELGNMFFSVSKYINAGFIKRMIRLNLIAKGIRLLGGLSKGLSTPLSWIFTLIKFHGLGKAAKGIDNVTKIASKGKALEKAAETTANMALSWQQVAMRGINIAGIGVVAAAIKLIASAFVDIGKADMNLDKFVGFAAGAATLIGEFAGLAQILGAKGALTGVAQLSRVFGEAEIALVAQGISAIAKAMNDVSDVEVPKKSKLKKILKAVSDFADVLPSTDIFTAIGKFFSSTAVTNTAKAVSSVTQAINSVNSLKGNLKKFRKVMFGDIDTNKSGAGGGSWGDNNDSIVGIMSDMLDTFDKNPILDTLTERWKSSNIAVVFSSLASMMTDFTTIANTKIKPKQIEKATSNIETLSKSIRPLLESFDELYSMEFGTWNGAGRTQAERKGAGAAKKSFSSSYGAQAQGFTKMMEQLDLTFEYVSSMITKLNKMKGKLDKLNTNYGDDFGVLSFAPIGGIISAITGMFDVAGVSTGDYSLAPENMEYIDSAMDTLSSVVDKMNDLKTKIAELTQGGGEGGFVDIGAQIGGVVSGLIAACSRTPELQTSVAMLSAAIGVLKGALDKIGSLSGNYTAQVANIKSAINQLGEIGTQTIIVSVTVEGKVTENVTAKISETALAITKAMNLILTKYEKSTDVSIELGEHTDTVSPYLRGVASRIMSAFNSIPSTLNKTVTVNVRRLRNEVPIHTGGKVGHKVQYRAHGGSIFQPKGTDTVPAMLTPGEYVVNHMAANAIGYDVLQKLNHLDIAGAIKGLYSRATSTSTINNTKNANVTVNNYNAPSVGFAKASRWVASL